MSRIESLRRGPDHTLLAFLEDPALVVSTRGRVAYVNPAFQRRFSAHRAEAVGKKLSQLLPPRIADLLLEHLRLLEPASPPHNFWMGSERERFRVSMSAIALNGSVAGALVTMWDHSRESILKHQNLEVFRALVDDLRLPVAEMASLHDQPRADGETIRSSVRAQTELLSEGLSRLLDFGEVFFGEARPEPTPFDPSRLLALARKSLRLLAQQRGVYVEDGSARELPRLVGDAALLNRLLGLLVDYMIKTVPPHELVILSAELVLTPAGQARLAYSITGTGVISLEQDLMKGEVPLTTAFSGLSDERKRLLLRLFLARRLVAAMDGTIAVAAHEAAGTTILVQVPVQIHFGK
jgi:K+-sensing histidine kinase KdpD